MKRLLTFWLVSSIIISMLIGVSWAESENELNILLTEDVFCSGLTATVQGEVRDNNDELAQVLDGKAVKIINADGEDVGVSGQVEGSGFSISFTPDAAGSYVLYVDSDEDGNLSSVDSSVSFNVISYSLDLASDIVIQSTEQVILQGNVSKNSQPSNDLDGKKIYVMDENNDQLLTEEVKVMNSTFSFTFTPQNRGTYKVVVDSDGDGTPTPEIDATTTFAVKSLSIELDHTAIVKSDDEVTIKGVLYEDGTESTVFNGQDVSIIDELDNVLVTGNMDNESFELTITPSQVGTYYVVIDSGDGSIELNQDISVAFDVITYTITVDDEKLVLSDDVINVTGQVYRDGMANNEMASHHIYILDDSSTVVASAQVVDTGFTIPFTPDTVGTYTIVLDNDGDQEPELGMDSQVTFGVVAYAVSLDNTVIRESDTETSISGTIHLSDQETADLTGAQVVILDSNNNVLETGTVVNSTVTLNFTPEEYGSYTLVVDSDGDQTAEVDLDASAAFTVEAYDLVLNKTKIISSTSDITLTGTVYVNGVVSNKFDGRDVYILDENDNAIATTTIEGAAFTRKVERDDVGTYTVVVDVDGQAGVDLTTDLVAEFNVVNYTLELNKDSLDKKNGYRAITGRILVDESYSRDLDDMAVYVVYDENNSQLINKVDGYKLEAMLNCSEAGTYKIVVDIDGEEGVNLETDLSANIDVVYDLDLEDELEFDFPVEDFVIIEGNVEGASWKDVTLCYANELDHPLASAKTNDDGDFVIAFNGELYLDQAGYLELWVEAEAGFATELLQAEGVVYAQSLDVELNNDEFPVGLIDEVLAITIDEDDLDKDLYSENDDDKLELDDDFYYTVTVENEDEEEIVELWDSRETLLEENTPSAWKLSDFSDLDKGTYTVIVELYLEEDAEDKLIMQGSTEFDVVKNTGYVLTGWNNFSEISVGDHEMVLGKDDGLDDPDTDNLVVYYSGNPYEYYVITYEGAGLEETIVHNLDEEEADLPYNLDDATYVEDNVVTITPTQAGSIDITIEAYEIEKGEYEQAKRYSKEIEVTGYSVEVNLDEVKVDTEYTLSITVTNEDGDAVNNAYVYLVQEDEDGDILTESLLVDPVEENIRRGNYEVDDWEWDSVGTLNIVVKKSASASADVMTRLTDAIEVIGERVFDVDANIDTLLRGNEETIILTITDEDGDPYFPNMSDIEIVEGGSITDIGGKKDLDDDNIKESVEVTVLVDGDADDTIRLRVTDDGGKDQGEMRFDVESPEIRLDSGSRITENLRSELSFTIIDPRNGDTIEELHEVRFELKNIDCDREDEYTVVWYDENKDEIEDWENDLKVTSDEEETFEYYLTVSGVDWDAAEDEGVKPELVIEVALYDGGEDYYVEADSIPLAQANLEATPDTMVMGTNNIITLYYSDANGDPLADYEVYISGDKIGTTDDDGQLIYSAASVSTSGITFAAETDAVDVDGDDVFVSKKVESSLDLEPPVISVPSEVNSPQVTLTVSDNVRVSAIRVNGEMLSIFPLQQVTETLLLEEGENIFKIEAMDVNNNSVSKVVRVTYQPWTEPTTPDTGVDALQLQVGVESEYGKPELISGTTMVPVRFATKLGATMAWNNKSKTVTYIYGDTVIAMTVGDFTAYVNGEVVRLAVAPYINQQNFTMVPLRMIAQQLGFAVTWSGNDKPIIISK